MSAPGTGAQIISRAGWHPRAVRTPSSNADARPRGVTIDLLVIHNISLPPGVFGGDAVTRLFTNRLDVSEHPYYAGLGGLRVSAHFLVSRNGALAQFVSTEKRAWHAGASRWRGRAHCNDFSVGIELEGTDDLAYTVRQYQRLAVLTRVLAARYPSIAGVAGHSEIAPGRKTDPGPAFDWNRFMRESGLPQGFRSFG